MMNYTEKTYKKYEILQMFGLSRSQGHDLETKGFILKVASYKYKYDLNFFTEENIENYKSLWKQDAKKAYSLQRRRVMLRLWSTSEYRESQSQAIKTGQSKPESRANMSAAQILRYSTEEAHLVMKAAMSRPEVIRKISNSNIVTATQKRLSGYYETEEWKKVSRRQKMLEVETRRKNGTFTTSRIAEHCKQLLRDAGFTVEEEKPYPNAENLHCDAYVKELDLWIEFHYCHYHGPKRCHEPFNSLDDKHINALAALKKRFIEKPKNSKGTNQYGIMIYTWTDLDVRKRQCAKDNNLSWLAFYLYDDFYKWYSTII